jgi:isopentenyl-diphosphate delta-isomerase
VNEELGITCLTLEHRGQVEYRADVGNGLVEHEVVEVFLANAAADMPLVPNPEEVMATRWVTPNQLATEIDSTPNIFTPWLRIYLAKHADMILG